MTSREELIALVQSLPQELLPSAAQELEKVLMWAPAPPASEAFTEGAQDFIDQHGSGFHERFGPG
ncbi:hypothetical protein ACFQ6C_26415 [Streptomyces sp. NPDC056454]|uniref:hypothetical protein n=1 Tax=Streptomyces sp. NPDC056454 TaxID=3345823 RepID=UPI0036B740D4